SWLRRGRASLKVGKTRPSVISESFPCSSPAGHPFLGHNPFETVVKHHIRLGYKLIIGISPSPGLQGILYGVVVMCFRIPNIPAFEGRFSQDKTELGR